MDESIKWASEPEALMFWDILKKPSLMAEKLLFSPVFILEFSQMQKKLSPQCQGFCCNLSKLKLTLN